MLRTPAIRSTAALALLVLAPGAAQERIAFAPVPGTRVAKTIESKVALELWAAHLVSGGEREPIAIETTATSRLELAVTDTYVASAAGRPTALERRFDRVARESSATSRAVMLGGGERTSRATSPLEGRTVRFEARPDGGTDRRFADSEEPASEAERALLDGLDADLDLLAWLPGEALRPGDTFEVEAAAFAFLLAPSGDLALVAEDEPGHERLQAFGLDRGLASLLGPPEGEVRGTFVAIEGPAGARVAKLRYEVDLRCVSVHDGEAWPGFGDPDPPDDDAVVAETGRTEVDAIVEATVEVEFELDAGRFRSLAAEGEIDLRTVTTLDLVHGRDRTEVTVELGFRGTLGFSAAVRTL